MTSNLYVEVEKACQTYEFYLKLLNGELDEIPEDRRGEFKFGVEDLAFRTHCKVLIYGISVHIRDLARIALRADNTFLEQSERERLGEVLHQIEKPIASFETDIPKFICRGYEDSF